MWYHMIQGPVQAPGSVVWTLHGALLEAVTTAAQTEKLKLQHQYFYTDIDHYHSTVSSLSILWSAQY